MKESGDRLKLFRKKRKLTQVELGEIIGLKPSSYNRLEKGENNFTEKHLVILNEAFGLSVDWLLLGIGDIYGNSQSFGENTAEVNQMLNDMRKNKSVLFGTLSAYNESMERLRIIKNQEQQLNNSEE